MELTNCTNEELIAELVKRGAELIKYKLYQEGYEVSVRKKYSDDRTIEVVRKDVLILF